MITLVALFAASSVTFVACAPVGEDKSQTVVQTGGIWPGVAPVPATGIPTGDPCNHGDDRLILVGLSFQCRACDQDGGQAPLDTRPSLSTSASAPWYPQLVREPAAPYYWAYQNIQVSAWIATVESFWGGLLPTAGGALSNFRYPVFGWGSWFEENPLWMQWKAGGDNVYTTGGFDNAGRALYGGSSFSWGSANMIRGGYRPPPYGYGIWFERWLLLCRGGGIAPTDALPYLDMHLQNWEQPETHQVVIRRHPANSLCRRVTYSCQEAIVAMRRN